MRLTNEQLAEFRKAIQRDEFAAQIGSSFVVHRDSETFEAKLIEVSEIKTSARTEMFRLIFLLPEGFSPNQGSFLFEHPEIGSKEIFIVPIEQETDGLIFEALFNRLLPRDQT